MLILYTNDYNESVQLSLPVTWHVAKNFTLKELANNKASESVKFISTPRSRKFMQMIQEFRTGYGKSMTVNSCYRTKTYNSAIGGDMRSLHLDALALDWGVSGHTQAQREAVRERWLNICKKYGEIGGINYYTHGYHLDIGEEQFGYEGFVTRDYRGKRGDW